MIDGLSAPFEAEVAEAALPEARSRRALRTPPATSSAPLRQVAAPPLLPLPRAPAPHAQDLAACREAIRHGSRSFHAASRLLPRRVREPALALYAFCRCADDAVDEEADEAAAKARAVQSLRARLDLVYEARPQDHPADRAMAAIVERFEMPRALPEALIEGLEWDAQGRTYETLDDLHAYAARVAGAVGAMMTVLMGVRRPEALARACDMGNAMQLTNMARDVGEDARAGRLFLPKSWLREVGIDPAEFLADPRFTPELGGLVERMLAEADRLYARARPGVGQLPAVCRPAIHAAGRIYGEIGAVVRAQGCDSVSARAVTTTRRKLALAGRAMGDAAWSLAPGMPKGSTAPALPACAFLVEAAARPTPPRIRASTGADAQVSAFIAVLSDLEARDRARRDARRAV